MYGQVVLIGNGIIDVRPYTTKLPTVMHGLNEYLLTSHRDHDCYFTIIQTKYADHHALYLAAAHVIVAFCDGGPPPHVESWIRATLEASLQTQRVCPHLMVVTPADVPPWLIQLQTLYSTPLPLTLIPSFNMKEARPSVAFLEHASDLAWTQTCLLQRAPPVLTPMLLAPCTLSPPIDIESPPHSAGCLSH